MKLSQLFEYQVYGTLPRWQVKMTLADGNLYKKDLKFIKTNDPRVKVGWMKPDEHWFSIYVFLDGECHGVMEVDFSEHKDEDEDDVFNDIRRLFPKRPIGEPHITISETLRNLGYAKFLYSVALDKGCIFYTEMHSSDANALWDRLSAKYDSMYYSKRFGLTHSLPKSRKDERVARMLGKNLSKARQSK